ncbi:hypothetical protein FACS1894177_09460 [Bacteroidia bacterium]|nr:hypothetical protein FACS1894177_09460 [Bacteroidia bacterium]
MISVDFTKNIILYSIRKILLIVLSVIVYMAANNDLYADVVIIVE